MRRITQVLLTAGAVAGFAGMTSAANPTIGQPVEFKVSVAPSLRLDGDATQNTRTADTPVVLYDEPFWATSGKSATVTHSYQCNSVLLLTLSSAQPANVTPAVDLTNWGAYPARPEKNLDGTLASTIDYLPATFMLGLPSGLQISDTNGLLSGVDGKLVSPTGKSLTAQNHANGNTSVTLTGTFDISGHPEIDAGDYYGRVVMTFTALPAL